MTAYLLFILCQLLTVTHAALVIDVQPSRIQPGLTNNLVVNCSITDNKVPQMLKINSLVLSRVTSTDNDTIEELIILNYNESNNTSKTSKNPKGSIGFNGASYVSLTWPNPSYRDASKYKCEARGLSTSFNKISAAAYASVETDEPDIRSLVDELLHLRKETYETSNSLKEVKQKYASLNEVLQKSVNKLNAEKQVSKKSFFIASNVFQGKRYYMSRKQASNDINKAQATCAFYGGYLVEIDTTDEYTFIVNFIKSVSANDSTFSCVYNGLMDPENDGIWTHVFTKKDSKFLPWGKGEPQNQADYNCMCLEKSYNWRYNDLPCYYADVLRYLCEIPEDEQTLLK
uniref:C-type lectin domain-containing protein n=1 Tax=Biomphalaria glabrata TaxID=6526 RepID=A0A2C9M0S3_BIOGL